MRSAFIRSLPAAIRGQIVFVRLLLLFSMVVLITGAVSVNASTSESGSGPRAILKGEGGDGTACPRDHVCLWKGKAYTGKKLALAQAAATYDLAAFGFDRNVSSMKNRIDHAVSLRRPSNHGSLRSHSLCVGFQQRIPTLSQFGWNNEATKLRISPC